MLEECYTRPTMGIYECGGQGGIMGRHKEGRSGLELGHRLHPIAQTGCQHLLQDIPLISLEIISWDQGYFCDE